MLPEATPGSEPSWFGFPLTLRDPVRVPRHQLLKALADRRVGTRLLFGGNLTRQPYMQARRFRVSGSLERTDVVMERTFWIGLFPGLSEAMLDYSADILCELLRGAQ